MEAYWVESDVNKIAQSWHCAMELSKIRLARVYNLEGDSLEQLIYEGRLVLETVCLFVHCEIKLRNYV